VHLTTMIKSAKIGTLLLVSIISLSLPGQGARGQGERDGSGGSRGPAKPVTVPVTVRVREPKREVEMRTVNYLLREDGEMQTILSVRGPAENPLTLAILIQDDLVPSIASETRGIAAFIRHLPVGSRIMVGYIRSGSLEVRRKFTSDLERAATSVRIPLGTASAGPYNPFVEIIEALRRFDAQPLGRRAIIVVSDGLDVSRGLDSSSPGQSLDLQRAITEAQRRGVAIYSIYAPAAAAIGNQLLSANGQGCLEKLSTETGGQAFFQGTGAPVSFDPFLKQIDQSLSRQIALTYLSTHTNKGFHKLDIKPLDRDVEIRHPTGYSR
jgi:VWFA-related protein